MLLALNCARDYGVSHVHNMCFAFCKHNDVCIPASKRMSHTWVAPSSSTRVQGQRSSGHRAQHSGRQEPGHLRARGEPDAQFVGVRRPGAVASIRTQSSEGERSEYGHTRPLDRSDRMHESEGIARPEHEQPLNDSQAGRLQRSSQGGFYIQHPNPSQNHKLLTVAKKEEFEYKQHKQAKRTRVAEQSRQYTPQALGGNSCSEEETRVKQERDNQVAARFAGIRQMQKREKYAEEKRRREEKELEDKKRVQREKAVRLVQKQGREEQQRRDEMRQKRLERFDPPKNF